MLKKNKYSLQNRTEIKEITTSHFLRLVSQDAGFTLSDTRIFWRSVMRIMARAIVSEKTLKLRGLGKIYVKTIPPRKMWIGLKKKEAWVDESKRVVFQISDGIKNALYDNVYAEGREAAKYFDELDLDDFEDEDDSEFE